MQPSHHSQSIFGPASVAPRADATWLQVGDLLPFDRQVYARPYGITAFPFIPLRGRTVAARFAPRHSSTESRVAVLTCTVPASATSGSAHAEARWDGSRSSSGGSTDDVTFRQERMDALRAEQDAELQFVLDEYHALSGGRNAVAEPLQELYTQLLDTELLAEMRSGDLEDLD